MLNHVDEPADADGPAAQDDAAAGHAGARREVLGSVQLGAEQVAIARAQRSDLEQIVALLTDDMLGKDRETHASHTGYQEAFAAIDADPNQVLLVALDGAAQDGPARADGRVVATAQVTFIPGLSRGGALRGQIEAVRVGAEYRGQGLGRGFFDWIIDYCDRRGAALVQLTTDKRRRDAVRFYERLGFVASHEGMKLNLPR